MTGEDSSVFPSDETDDIARPLFGFLVVSLLAHVAAVYVLQVVYPPPIAQFPADARVVLLTPATTPAAFLSWVEANDPANVFGALGGAPEPGGAGLADYRPSYEGGRLSLRGELAPRTDLTVDTLPMAEALPIPVGSSAKEGAQPSRPSRNGRFVIEAMPDRVLARALGTDRIKAPGLAAADFPARPARFGFVWRPEFFGPQIFLIESTGDALLDDRLAAVLRSLRPRSDRPAAGEITFRTLRTAAGRPEDRQ